MQRTTVRLDDDLMRDAKRMAAESGITLTALIESALRERLARRDQPPAKRDRIKLITVAGVLLPGYDPDRLATQVIEEEDARGAPFHT